MPSVRGARRSQEVFSWPLAGATVVVILALAANSVVTLCALIGCALGAFFGPLRAIQAMMAATLIAYGSNKIIKAAPFGGVILRVVLLVLVLRILPTIRSSDLRLIWPVWLFGLICAASSAITSPALPISLMKISELTLASSAVLIAYNHLNAEDLQKAQRWLLTIGITVIVLSGLTLPLGGLGIGGNGGLQGILNQPQALGIFIAPFAAWSIAGVLLMRQKASRLEVWLAIGTLVLIVLTKARTAAVATLFGVLVVIAARFFGGRRGSQARLGRPIAIIATVGVVILVIGLSTGKLTDFVTDYAYKGSKAENRTIGAAFYDSRGGGVLAEWNNFLNSPLLGNGFGVYPDGRFPSGVTEFRGIPISAPIEKGFLPTAALEEDGIIGSAFLLLLIVWLSSRAWRNADLRWRAMFVACLGMNFGECVFLSPGGIGMFEWLLLALAMNSYRTAPLEIGASRSARSRIAAASATGPGAASAEGSAANPAAVTGLGAFPWSGSPS